MQYPVHTLAPDPLQPELNLKPPPEEKKDSRPRASPRVLCHHCGAVHSSQQEVLRCGSGS